MKRTLMLAAFFAAIAMVSYGGSALLAQAQTAPATMTPANTATLQQQLDDAKAELIQLQMQAGQVPAGDTGLPSQPTVSATVAPTVTLSASDVVEVNAALTALANMLTSLQVKIAQDPQFISTNGPVVISALQGIGNTIASIGTDVATGNIAMTSPQTAPTTATPPAQPGQIAQTSPAAGTTPSTGNTGATVAPSVPTTPTTPTTPANTTPVANTAPLSATASSFSLGKLNWPLIIIIILIVAAIAIWLWWDDGEDTKQPAVRTNSPAPQRPAQPLQSTNQVSLSSNQGQNANRQPSNSQTPLSSAVAQHGN